MTKDQQPSQGDVERVARAIQQAERDNGKHLVGFDNLGPQTQAHLRMSAKAAIAAIHSISEGRATILADEVSAVHDALGYLENFEVHEPDLHLTRVECRAILRDAAKHLRGGSNE